jgi:hypothetical protein
MMRVVIQVLVRVVVQVSVKLSSFTSCRCSLYKQIDFTLSSSDHQFRYASLNSFDILILVIRDDASHFAVNIPVRILLACHSSFEIRDSIIDVCESEDLGTIFCRYETADFFLGTMTRETALVFPMIMKTLHRT